MKYILSATVLFGAHLALAGEPQSCTDVRSYFDSHTSNITEAKAIEALARTDYQVLLLGENHTDGGARARRKDLLKALDVAAKAPIDCVLMELPHDWQSSIDRVVKGEVTLSQFGHEIFPSRDNEDDQYMYQERQRFTDLLVPSVQFVQGTAKKLLLIDDDKRNLESKYDGEYTLGERNALFAEKIEKLFDSQECTRAVFIVGASHIGGHRQDLTYKSMQQHLTAMGLKHQSAFAITRELKRDVSKSEVHRCELDFRAGSAVATDGSSASGPFILSDFIKVFPAWFKTDGWIDVRFSDFNTIFFH